MHTFRFDALTRGKRNQTLPRVFIRAPRHPAACGDFTRNRDQASRHPLRLARGFECHGIGRCMKSDHKLLFFPAHPVRYVPAASSRMARIAVSTSSSVLKYENENLTIPWFTVPNDSCISGAQ